MTKWKAWRSAEVVIDSSALLAIFLKEPEATKFAHAIAQAHERYISAVTMVEIGIALSNRMGPSSAGQLDDAISSAGIQIVPFDAQQSAIARKAYERFGRRRHPARLNFGDCAAYALAAAREQPLLFKGNDFALTDVARAPWS